MDHGMPSLMREIILIVREHILIVSEPILTVREHILSKRTHVFVLARDHSLSRARFLSLVPDYHRIHTHTHVCVHTHACVYRTYGNTNLVPLSM